MKHYKRGEDKANAVEPACDFVRPEVCVQRADPERVVEKRTVLVEKRDCVPSVHDGGQSSQVVVEAGDNCIVVDNPEPNKYTVSLASCENGADFEQCGITIQQGVVTAFAKPVMGVTSSDGTLDVTQTACGVDLSIASESAALPVRVLCEQGPCQEAGKAIGIVQVVKAPSGFQLVGCALAGEGATNAVLGNLGTTTYATLTAAVEAMNAVTLDATFGSCGGNGP